MRRMTLDELTRKCGYFTSKTKIASGYGCNHTQCEDWDYAKLMENDDSVHIDTGEVQLLLYETKFGAYLANTRLSEEQIEWLTFAQHDSEELAKIGVKMQGKCFSFTCPIAYYKRQNSWDGDTIMYVSKGVKLKS